MRGWLDKKVAQIPAVRRKFHENAHSPRQRGGKLEEGKEDGMEGGGIVRVGCKPAAVLENRTVDGAANTTMPGAAQKRSDQTLTHARQADACGDKDGAAKYVCVRSLQGN